MEFWREKERKRERVRERERKSGKDEVQSSSDRFGAVLVKGLMEGCRLFQIMGSLLERAVGNFEGICIWIL